jgi:Cu2+-exporting ATPase
MFRDRFWITLALTIPTLVWSEMIQGWLGFRAPTFVGSRYIPPIFGMAVYFYGGWVFLAGGVRELRDRLPGMMTLISLAISVSFAFSLAVTLGYPGEALWWELATLVTIMLLGHWIEMRSIFQASGALRELARLLPSTAQRVVDDRVEEVPIAALGEGDLVLVRPGASIPADGVVRNGNSDVNESMITGESAPVSKAEGEKVIAGTVNGPGSLRTGASLPFARPGIGRPCGVPAHAYCHWCRRRDVDRMDGARRPRFIRHRAGRIGTRCRLSSRAWLGGPARDRHFDDTRCQVRVARP